MSSPAGKKPRSFHRSWLGQGSEPSDPSPTAASCKSCCQVFLQIHYIQLGSTMAWGPKSMVDVDSLVLAFALSIVSSCPHHQLDFDAIQAHVESTSRIRFANSAYSPIRYGPRPLWSQCNHPISLPSCLPRYSTCDKTMQVTAGISRWLFTHRKFQDTDQPSASCARKILGQTKYQDCSKKNGSESFSCIPESCQVQVTRRDTFALQLRVSAGSNTRTGLCSK